MKRFEIKIGSPVIFTYRESIVCMIWNYDPNKGSFFEESEIVSDFDGILTVIKSYYPKDGHHKMLVQKNNVI